MKRRSEIFLNMWVYVYNLHNYVIDNNTSVLLILGDRQAFIFKHTRHVFNLLDYIEKNVLTHFKYS